VGRGGDVPPGGSGGRRSLEEIAERYVPEVARDLGVDPDRVRAVLRRLTDR
jgi:hypothetical protein